MSKYNKNKCPYMNTGHRSQSIGNKKHTSLTHAPRTMVPNLRGVTSRYKKSPFQFSHCSVDELLSLSPLSLSLFIKNKLIKNGGGDPTHPST